MGLNSVHGIKSNKKPPHWTELMFSNSLSLSQLLLNPKATREREGKDLSLPPFLSVLCLPLPIYLKEEEEETHKGPIALLFSLSLSFSLSLFLFLSPLLSSFLREFFFST